MEGVKIGDIIEFTKMKLLSYDYFLTFSVPNKIVADDIQFACFLHRLCVCV